MLGTAPRFWGDMHFNVKDVPETIYFGATLMAYWVWHEAPTRKRALVAGLLMGCALAAKPNAVFILPILLVSIMPWRPDRGEWLALAQALPGALAALRDHGCDRAGVLLPFLAVSCM